MADPKRRGLLHWHHAPLLAPLPACLYSFTDAKSWISILVPSMTYAVARGHSPAHGSCWEGKVSPRQGWSQPRPICCGVWDVSVPPTSAHSRPLSPPGGTQPGMACWAAVCPQHLQEIPVQDREAEEPSWAVCSALLPHQVCLCAVIQEFFGDEPGMTHWAGFPQPALRHQLHHFIEGVFWKPEDTVLSPTLLGHHHSLPKPSPRSIRG